MWRGPPPRTSPTTPSRRRRSPGFDEARLEAVEERVDVELALGMHYELVPELEQLVRDIRCASACRGS